MKQNEVQNDNLLVNYRAGIENIIMTKDEINNYQYCHIIIIYLIVVKRFLFRHSNNLFCTILRR